MATPVTFKYNIKAFWDDEFKRLDYIQEQFNDPAKLAEWHSIGYKNVATGYMCDMRSPQPSWNDLIVKHFEKLGWRDVGTSYYRMTAGTILPEHQDLYKKYIELFNLKGREHTIRRAIIMLEDWKSGHYLEVNGIPVVKWRAGCTIEWEYDTPHMAANVGLEDRYTLQVTGHVDD